MGPFIVTLTISMFILILQFFWVYIDDLMGKGLSSFLILELLFYVSASLVPLALPLAILLSSLMTFGNLAEHNELTALKSSGLSLYRIMRPLTFVVLIIAISTFFFANYVIPVANLKWHTLIYDIQNTKISTVLTPGVYTKDFDGYAIKVKYEKDSVYYDITIHDRSIPGQVRTVKAKEARIFKSKYGNYLFFDLKKGQVFEEMNAQVPYYSPEGIHQNPAASAYPHRVSKFDHGLYKLDLSGFTFNRTKEDVFTDKYEMMNVFQIKDAMDSLELKRLKSVENNVSQLKNDRSLFNVVDTVTVEFDDGLKKQEIPVQSFDKLTAEDQKLVRNQLLSQLRRINQNLDNQNLIQETFQNEADLFWIEFHRKFALTFSIIVLFFVGAPLGALIRKGGFGAPVVIAALIFMVYFVITSIGDNLSKTFVVSPFWGMWMAAFFFTPLAILITISAANDRPLFSRDNFDRLLHFFKKKS